MEGTPRRLGQARGIAAGRHAFHRAIASLVDTVNEHDTYTAGHSYRVADYVGFLGDLLGLPPKEVVKIKQAGLIHDLGKIGVPENVLTKKEPLTDAEFDLIKVHPVVGASILSHLPGSEELLPVVLHHHERWDGRGYPDGLSGTDIPLPARIILVADAFDAMTTQRPYGPVLSVEEALAELRACSGRQFDPRVVDAMHAAYAHGLLAAIRSSSTHPRHSLAL